MPVQRHFLSNSGKRRNLVNGHTSAFLAPPSMGYSQSGAGFLDTLMGGMEKVADFASTATSKAKDLLVNGVAGKWSTDFRNLMPSADATGRPSFPGELHAPLKLANGWVGQGNYIGPGTRIVERTRRQDPPRTLVDKVAQAHDLRYKLHPEQSRSADLKMINKLQEIARTGGDSRVNTRMAEGIMRAKVAAEKIGILDPNRFVAKSGTPMTPADRHLLAQKLNELEQEGFGAGDPRPGQRLVKSLGKRKQTSRKYGKTPKKMKGKGLNFPTPGPPEVLFPRYQQGSGIKTILETKVVPAMLDSVGLTRKDLLIHPGGVKGLMNKALAVAKQPKDVAASISAHFIPVLLATAHKKLGIQKGSGITKAKVTMLQKQLQKALSNSLNLANEQAGNGLISSQIGKGAFGDFFKGFSRGFLGVLKPALKIASFVDPTGISGAAAKGIDIVRDVAGIKKLLPIPIIG